MNEPSPIRTEARPAAGAAAAVARVALDARRPQRLDHRGRAIRLIAGHADLFSLGSAAGTSEGARRHLFRVESGEIILDLPEDGDNSRRVQVIAVGGPGAEAMVLPREELEDLEPVAAWIAKLSAVIVGSNVDWEIREIEPEVSSDIEPGERRRGAARGIFWVSVTAGSVRVMGLEAVYTAGSSLIPLTAGMWIEAEGEGATLAARDRMPDGADLWQAVDRFHVCAMACIRSRLAAVAGREAQRLDRRIELTRTHTYELFDELSAVIVRPSDRARPEADATNSLLAACREVANAIQVTIVRPPGRTPSQQGFTDLVEIARASRLRVRRTLLRANWWRQDVGPLVGWHGEARNPVALVPTSRHRYLMIDPGSGARRLVDEKLATELAVEAAMFYPPLPARSLSFWDLLSFAISHARGNALRIMFGVVALGLLSLAAPLITQVLVNSVIPRTELDQLAYCALALGMTALAMAGLQAMQGAAMLRLEGMLDWKLQAAVVDRLLRLPASVFREHTVGDLADRAMGIDAIRRIATGRTLRGLLAGILCWFSFALMIYYDLRTRCRGDHADDRARVVDPRHQRGASLPRAAQLQSAR